MKVINEILRRMLMLQIDILRVAVERLLAHSPGKTRWEANQIRIWKSHETEAGKNFIPLASPS